MLRTIDGGRASARTAPSRWATARVAVAVAAWVTACGIALAQQNIGTTALVRKDVTRNLAGKPGNLARGEAVFNEEGIITGVQSFARLVFLDSTNFTVGPRSRIVLKPVVFDPNPSAQKAAFSLVKGLFRFATGILDKRAYSIETPAAYLTIRGTILDIAVDTARKTRVTLREGAVLVCPRNKGKTLAQQLRDCEAGPAPQCDCVQLDKTGQTASVAPVNGVERALLSGAPVDLAPVCSADPGACAITDYAQTASPEQFAQSGSPAVLCGR